MKPASDHWYDPATREARHFIEKKDGSGTRPTTIADARKHGWYPSVTTILKAANKPALTEWLCRNAATAALTTPRLVNEPLDIFLERILSRDAIDESEKAKDKGTAVHDAVEKALNGQPYDIALAEFVEPTMKAAKEFGAVSMTETVVIGDRYAGKLDTVLANSGLITVLDFKTCKNLPKKAVSWFEHQMQLAAYALTLCNTGNDRIQTANIYISTSEPGKVLPCVNKEWDRPAKAFLALAEYWRLMNDFLLGIKPAKEFPHLKPTETKLVEPTNFDVIP